MKFTLAKTSRVISNLFVDKKAAVCYVIRRIVYVNTFIKKMFYFIILELLSFRSSFRYLHPIYYGEYPEVMRKRLGDRLPEFTQEEKELLKHAVDFVGLNHYTSRFIAHATSPEEGDFYKAQEMERTGIITTTYCQVFHRKFISSSNLLACHQLNGKGVK